jgi:serine protease Do
MMARRVFLFFLFVTATFFGALAVADRIRTSGQSAASHDSAQPGPAPQASRTAPAMSGGLPDLTAVAERAISSVTNISSTQIVRTSNSPFANDPFFRYFFGDRQDDAFGYRDQRAQSLGSGVVVSADGYVLTNNHVVGQQGRGSVVTVALGDKREVRAQVVGIDDATDIALLKLDLRNLPVIPWGDSSKLKVAEWVLAIGNPFQLS